MTETPTLFRLDGQVAVITGAGGLLGGHHARALSDCGAHVVLSDRRVELCDTAAAELSSPTRPRSIAVACDVTSRESWEALLRRGLAEFGRVDILVNNAACTMQSPTPAYAADAVDCPLEDWQRILDVNLTGVLLGCQVFGRHMLERGDGTIINLASLYGIVSPNHRIYPDTGIHQPIAYAVSKGGVIALTRYLSTAWADRGVRVNCITPGGVYNAQPAAFTERYARLSPIGRMAQPDELRGALVFLASAASRYCTGHNLVVDGGWTVW